MTTIQRKRKHQLFQTARPPTYFFIGRQCHPPYAWAYDDEEMRASNIMWFIEDIIDDKNLDRMYFEEIASAKARGARMTREEVKGGRKRRKGPSGWVIDLSISDIDEGHGDADPIVNGRKQLKLIPSNHGTSVESPTISSANFSTSTVGPRSSHHTPTKRPFPTTAVDGKTVGARAERCILKRDDKLIQYVTEKPC